MAYSAWASSTAYVVGDIVRASVLQASGLVFRCTTAGTSAASEPPWGTDIGSTVTDNTVVWTAVASAFEELAQIAPSAIIELFEMTLDATLHGSSDTYRWHNGTNAAVTGNIVWNGNSYGRLPIQAEGFDYTNTGSLPRPTLTISNLDSTMTILLILVNATTAGNDLGGAMVKRIRTLKKYLDGETGADPHAKFPDEIWYVDRKANENRNSVSFELASKFDLAGVMLPKRQLIANVCQWRYRGTECGYTGTRYFNANDGVEATLAADVCGKRLSSCELRFGQVVGNGTVTEGSDQLVVDSASNIGAGDPVSGFAVPSGTTVLSVSGDTVTMSANATASTSVEVSGTLQASLNQIVVSSATGLSVGMTVTGTHLPATGATVTDISGTTVTIGQKAKLKYILIGSVTLIPAYANVKYNYRGIPTTEHIANTVVFGTVPAVGDILVSKYADIDQAISVTYVDGSVGGSVYTSAVKYTERAWNDDMRDKQNISYSDKFRYNATIYRLPTPGLETYAFVAPNNQYTFRTDVGLPYGSFPGVGLTQ